MTIGTAPALETLIYSPSETTGFSITSNYTSTLLQNSCDGPVLLPLPYLYTYLYIANLSPDLSQETPPAKSHPSCSPQEQTKAALSKQNSLTHKLTLLPNDLSFI